MCSTARNECWDSEKLPPPVTAVYEPRGSWTTIQKFSTYVAGAHDPRRVLVIIHDAFGPSSQIIQGADRFATQTDALVLLPDMFHGNSVSHDEYVKDPDTSRYKMRGLIAVHGDFNQTAAVILAFTKAAKEQYPSAVSWGVFGLCWGGKVAVLAGLASDSPFKVSGQTHPAGLDAEDAKAMNIPHICLASKDEPVEVVAKYRAILEVKELGRVETFEKSIHGWMGGRADLTDDDQKLEYERGYTMAADFFAENM